MPLQRNCTSDGSAVDRTINRQRCGQVTFQLKAVAEPAAQWAQRPTQRVHQLDPGSYEARGSWPEYGRAGAGQEHYRRGVAPQWLGQPSSGAAPASASSQGWRLMAV